MMGTAGARGETEWGRRGTFLRVTSSPPVVPPHPPTPPREDNNNSGLCLHPQLKTPIITATGMVSPESIHYRVWSTIVNTQLVVLLVSVGREEMFTNSSYLESIVYQEHSAVYKLSYNMQ